MLVVLFSGVAELAWSKGGRAQAQVVPSCSFRFSFSSFSFSFFIIHLLVRVVAFGRPAPHSWLSLSASPPAVCKHGWMIFLWFICFFSFLKLEELELWVPWMLPWDKVHMFLWQGTFRRTATTFTKNHHGVLLFTKKKQQGVLLTHFL